MRRTRGLTYDPYTHAEQLGVQVLRRELDGRRSLYLAGRGIIFLRPDLPLAEERTALTVQLGHVVLDHHEALPCLEAAALTWAASKLVDGGELRVLRERGLSVADIADELGVTVDIVTVYMMISSIPRRATRNLPTLIAARGAIEKIGRPNLTALEAHG